MADFSYILKKYFVASHIHNGEDIHGHNFYCIVEMQTEDTENAKKEFLNILNLLNYKVLNEIEFFKNNPPSTENIAVFIFENLKNKVNIKKIEVFETINFSGGVRR